MKKYLIILAASLSLLFTAQSANAGMETLLASAVRAATTSTADQVKSINRGVYVFLKVTAVPGVDTLTVTIQGKDVDGTYYTILASTASAATGTVTLKVYPGLPNTANVSSNEVLPDLWRVTVTHSAASNFTYSIVANTLP
jgi:hypothetical protein